MFSGCSSLTQIIIPSSVTEIGNYAFYKCSSLIQITIPSLVTSIGNNAFEECSSLAQIVIPTSLVSIGKSAFYGCSSLTQIVIPSSVTEIGYSAFEGCSLLSTETLKSINYIKSNMNNNNIDTPKLVNNKSNIKSFQEQNNTNSNHNFSSWTARRKNISMIHCNKPHSNNWSNLCENKSNEKNRWGLNSNSPNQNQFSFRTNNDKKSAWKTNDNNCDKNLTNEIEIMKMLEHPNIHKVVDIIYDDKKVPTVLYEKCSTDLKHAIQNKILSKVKLVSSIYQIAEGMKYIHSRKIIHLSLNPTNILISEDGTIKISNFKNAVKVTSENERREVEDVYSFGEIVYFILSGLEINNSEKETVLETFPLLARQLIEACLYDDLERRPTFEMICDVLEQNNFNLISLTQQEIEEVSKLISQYH